MNIVVEKQPKCTATLRVEISAEEVKGQREAITGKYARHAKVQGFRPGKAPISVITKKFSKEIDSELQEALTSEAVEKAVKEENLRVLEFGALSGFAPAEDGSISFTSTLILAPEITLPEYKGIPLTVPPLAVPQEDLDAQIQALRERFADFKTIEGRSLAMGDFAVMDYTSTVERKPTVEFLGKPAGHLSGREGYWVRLDEKAFLPGFAAGLVGLSTGDTKDVTVTIPDEFPIEELHGKKMTFAVTIKESKEATFPELDNAFAAKLAPGKTWEEVVEIIRTNMETERKNRIENMKVHQVAAHLSNGVEFDLPEALVARETQKQADSMVRRGIQSGMSNEEIETQQQELFAAANQQAVSQLRTNFILQEIAKAEKITVSNNELVNHLVNVAHSLKESPKKFIKEAQRSGSISSYTNSVAIGKTIDFLVDNAVVTESADISLEG